MLSARVSRGQNTGILVTPHKYTNGKYRVAMRKEGPYIEVDLDEIKSYLHRGYRVRMSNKLHKHPPGLISRESIDGWK
jgi:hypothetical protein